MTLYALLAIVNQQHWRQWEFQRIGLHLVMKILFIFIFIYFLFVYLFIYFVDFYKYLAAEFFTGVNSKWMPFDLFFFQNNLRLWVERAF